MIPYFSTNDWTFDLHVIAKYNHLTGGPSVGDTNVLMTQVLGRATLSGGQTAVFEKEMPEGGWLPDHTNATAGPRSMVVFVTPEPVDSAGNLLTQ